MLDRLSLKTTQALARSEYFWKVAKVKPEIIFLLKDIDIATDIDGISIWNRTSRTTMQRLFSDDPTNRHINSRKGGVQNERGKNEYWHYPVGARYSPEDLPQDAKLVDMNGPVIGMADFFGKGEHLLDLGCGGGESAVGFAKEYPALDVIAVDHAFGNEIPLRKSRLKNLKFEAGDWDELRFSNSTFDRFISDEGVGRYGHPRSSAKEMTRVAKIGAIFRGTIGKQVSGRIGFHNALVEEGWEVYRQGNIVTAIYKGPEFKAR